MKQKKKLKQQLCCFFNLRILSKLSMSDIYYKKLKLLLWSSLIILTWTAFIDILTQGFLFCQPEVNPLWFFLQILWFRRTHSAELNFTKIFCMKKQNLIYWSSRQRFHIFRPRTYSFPEAVTGHFVLDLTWPNRELGIKQSFLPIGKKNQKGLCVCVVFLLF